MSTEDMVARLKALSERLERLRRQAEEVRNVASAEVKAGFTHTRLRETPDQRKRPTDRPR
jgi:hypothetical protein